MTFTTCSFLLFLGIIFFLYHSLGNRTTQNLLLLVSSYFFYAWWDYRFCLLMLISSVVDFGVGLGLKVTSHPPKRKLLLYGSLLCNLGLLGFFKYFNFFIDNFVMVGQSLGMYFHPITLQIVLPVGISFYTFQTLSYTIDIYRGKMEATTRFIDYMAYVSFFPQLVAGPIERASHLLPQFHTPRTWNIDSIKDGFRQILWGFMKKMLLADNLGFVVDTIYASPATMNGGELSLATVFFAFQIYCDFSAYSDIAIGTARLFGFDLMRNFAYPYFSQSVSEFWRRWHISLSTWFRDYVFIPLGGSRQGRWKAISAILVTFVVSGLWHGASWNFIFWGAINGVGVLPSLVFEKRAKSKRSVKDLPGGEGYFPRPRVLLQMLFTFGVICMGWVFFRATTWSDSIIIMKSIFSSNWSLSFLTPMHCVLGMLIGGLVCVEWMQRKYPHPLMIQHWPKAWRWLTYSALIWISLIGSLKRGEFVYFQF